jgi:predicted Rossmann fold nucleotide-binding protein DprA/Smf involved in DNA uptake
LNNLYIETKIVVFILLIKEENSMKKVKDQLKTIAKSLLSLSMKVEKIAEQVDALRSVKPAPAAKKAVAKKAVAKKTAAKKKTPAAKAAPPKQLTVLNAVFDTIKRTKKGVTVAQLKEKLDLNAKQLSNTLYKLSKKGKIEAKSRGLYFKK